MGCNDTAPKKVNDTNEIQTVTLSKTTSTSKNTEMLASCIRDSIEKNDEIENVTIIEQSITMQYQSVHLSLLFSDGEFTIETNDNEVPPEILKSAVSDLSNCLLTQCTTRA